MTPALLCAALEVALNRYLALEPAVLAECGALAGRALALRVTPLDWIFHLELHAGGVRVLPESPAPAEVTVAGSLPLLLRTAWTITHGDSALPQGLAVDGDTELLTRFNRLLARVGFDPEELAAKFLPDAAAHRLTQGLRSLFDWSRASLGTLGLDTAEYLREETYDLARGRDVEDWLDAVDELRDATARFEARLERLEAQAKGERA